MKVTVRPRATAAPDRTAAPFPRLTGWTTTWSAPAASARAAVSSPEPSSTTMISTSSAPSVADGLPDPDHGVRHRLGLVVRGQDHAEPAVARRGGAGHGRGLVGLDGAQQDPPVAEDPHQGGDGEGDQLQAEQRGQGGIADGHDQDLQHGDVGQPGHEGHPRRSGAGRGPNGRTGRPPGRWPGAGRRTPARPPPARSRRPPPRASRSRPAGRGGLPRRRRWPATTAAPGPSRRISPPRPPGPPWRSRVLLGLRAHPARRVPRPRRAGPRPRSG